MADTEMKNASASTQSIKGKREKRTNYEGSVYRRIGDVRIK